MGLYKFIQDIYLVGHFVILLHLYLRMCILECGLYWCVNEVVLYLCIYVLYECVYLVYYFAAFLVVLRSCVNVRLRSDINFPDLFWNKLKNDLIKIFYYNVYICTCI